MGLLGQDERCACQAFTARLIKSDGSKCLACSKCKFTTAKQISSAFGKQREHAFDGQACASVMSR